MLTIVKDGSSLNIVNEGLYLTIVNETTNIIIIIIKKKKHATLLNVLTFFFKNYSMISTDVLQIGFFTFFVNDR